MLLAPSLTRAETVRVGYTRCPERPPLVDGAAVAAQARVELASTLDVMDPEDARVADTELRLVVCGASAKVSHRPRNGAPDEREIDLAAIAPDARVRVLALVLGELGRGQPTQLEAVPVPVRSHLADQLTPPNAKPRGTGKHTASRPRAREPRHYAQSLTFEGRVFTAPLSAAFGPRVSFAINRWEMSLESASSSTSQNGVQLVTGLAAVTLGYVAFRSGAPDSDTRFDVAPSFELGPTWVRAEVTSETSSQSAATADLSPRRELDVWVAGCVRAGLNVALTPPFHARFAALLGAARGLRSAVAGGPERTTSGVFFGLALGIGWER